MCSNGGGGSTKGKGAKSLGETVAVELKRPSSIFLSQNN